MSDKRASVWILGDQLLAQLAGLGFRVPAGLVIATRAYECFVEGQGLARLIRIELGRKPFASMRWEEIWDVAVLDEKCHLCLGSSGSAQVTQRDDSSRVTILHTDVYFRPGQLL